MAVSSSRHARRKPRRWRRANAPPRSSAYPAQPITALHRAARGGAFTRQAEERAALRTMHSAEWKAAKAEAAAMQDAYKAAFQAAHAKAKDADRAANKPLWRDLFRRQQADARSMDHAATHAAQQAAAARQEAHAAKQATYVAARRSHGLLGSLARKLGLAAHPRGRTGAAAPRR